MTPRSRSHKGDGRCPRRCQRWLATGILSIGLIALVGGHARGETTSEAEFRKWSRDLGKQEGFAICRWGQLTNPLTKVTGYFAWFYDSSGRGLGVTDADSDKTDGFAYLAFAVGDKKWLYTEPGDVLELPCEEPSRRFERRESLTIHRADSMGGHNWEDRDVTVDAELGPVVLRTQDGHNSGGGDDANTVDWKALVKTTEIHAGADPSDGEPSLTAQGALFPIFKPGLQGLGELPPARTWVTFGKKAWTGAADASMDVKVTAADKKFIVKISVTDDRHVPVKAGADPASLLRGDHIEIWYDAGGTSGPRQFGFPIPDAASPVAPLWLSPPKATGVPPAKISAQNHELVVELEMAALGVKDLFKAVEVPFTVVFSDSDDPAAGQQTLVATSQLHRKNWDSFGAITTGVVSRLPALEHVRVYTPALVRKLRPAR